MSEGRPGGTTLAALTVDMARLRDEHVITSQPRAAIAGIACSVVIASFAAVLALDGFPVWRIAAVVALIAAQVLNGFRVLRGLTDGRRVERAMLSIHVSGVLVIAALCALTGGLGSPFMIAFPVLMLPGGLLLGHGRATRLMALAVVAALTVLGALPASVTGPGLSAAARAAMSLVTVLWVGFVTLGFTAWMGRATRTAAAAVDSLREERVAIAVTQLRRLQTVGAKVAHELKNPLAAIKGLMQLVGRSPGGDRTPERLAVIDGEIARMETILHQYLSFSRPLEDLAPRRIDLLDVLDDVRAVLSGRASQAEVDLRVDGTRVAIVADPRRLKEALLNLAANAIEATPPGGRIAIELSPDAGGARIEVRDTGRGIAPEHLARVGTSFFTTRESGTGLGFVLARNVVEQHGGTLALVSAPGAGTTVTIHLPERPPTPPREEAV